MYVKGEDEKKSVDNHCSSSSSNGAKKKDPSKIYHSTELDSDNNSNNISNGVVEGAEDEDGVESESSDDYDSDSEADTEGVNHKIVQSLVKKGRTLHQQLQEQERLRGLTILQENRRTAAMYWAAIQDARIGRCDDAPPSLIPCKKSKPKIMFLQPNRDIRQVSRMIKPESGLYASEEDLENESTAGVDELQSTHRSSS